MCSTTLLGADTTFGGIGLASYPNPDTFLPIASISPSGLWCTVIVPAVTETDTSETPGIRLTAVSILLAQDAQSIPSTRNLVCSSSLMASILLF
ncbi:hypothetical protein ASD74_20195 [Rhizobium sp. Root564]|nr:hypothetical protein ASD74_20195 [Rhizobium sp. Root564]